ncbi:MAG: UDP-glucose 6-dehydrogenase [Alphaproteobacteria bacterium TMED87]|nr:UDP-glucose 6-dehydrogenase [Rhodospirillaceae bacterium]OUV12045.1 MAG: UDP-glucose 6-dehydrogenase [Alphaproteobacteria bacterium TMED87]
MRIAMIGTGYVGLVSGACFSEFGVDVTCVDKDENKIKDLNSGIIPIYEPGLDEIVRNNYKSGRLKFSTNLKESVKESEAIFIAVGTPSRRGDGHADLTYVYDVAKEIASVIDSYKVIAMKSTVPVGTGREVHKIIKKINPNAEFDIVSNPEFLREGSAINDFMRPDRVVIGVESEKAKSIMRHLYKVLYLIETPILYTNLETSEIIKYAANTFLATKITFINEISDFCEKVGADVHDVSKGIGLDKRIGSKFLHPGPGYGGSCFPKDTLAFIKSAQDYSSPLSIVETVVDINTKRKAEMHQRVINACNGSVEGKKIAILGLTFKPNTDDMRDSPALTIIDNLVEAGAVISAYDPSGMDEAKKIIKNIKFCKNSYETMESAICLVIITEWNEFRSLDFTRVRELMEKPVLVDLRNIYLPEDMRSYGFTYFSIGRSSS